MDHDDKIVGFILTRRDALRAAALTGISLALGGAANAGLPQAESAAVNLIVTPEVEEGPFFVDEGFNRTDLTMGTTRKSVVSGSPLALHFTVHAVRSGKARPLVAAHVDIWHADAAGSYSDEVSGPVQSEDTKGQKWLRGYQITGGDGVARFRTIYPGWYRSRTPHIHVKVRWFDADSNKTHVFNTQLFFDEALNDAILGQPLYNERGDRRVRNLWDGLYAAKQADGTLVGSHLHFAIDNPADGSARVARFALALQMG